MLLVLIGLSIFGFCYYIVTEFQYHHILEKIIEFSDDKDQFEILDMLDEKNQLYRFKKNEFIYLENYGVKLNFKNGIYTTLTYLN